MSRREIAIAAVALTMAAAIYTAVFFYWEPTLLQANNVDFFCFWRAGKMVLTGNGSQVYNFDEERKFDERIAPQIFPLEANPYSLPFLFTPPSLLLFAPLAALPYRQAEVVRFAANVAILLLLPIWLGRKLHLPTNGLIACILFPALLLGVTIALLQGQPSILIAALLGAVFLALDRGRDVTAGILLALAAIKPQLILPMALAFIAARKWKLIASFLATGVGLVLLSSALVGWRALAALPATIISYAHWSRAQDGEVPMHMLGLRGLSVHLFRSASGQTVFLAAGTLACLTIIWFANRRGINASAYGLTLVATIVIAYHCYIHDATLIILLVPLLCSEISAKGWNSNRIAVAVGLVTLLLAPNVPGGLSSMVTCYSLILIALLFPLYKESRQEGSVAARANRAAVASRAPGPVPV